MNLSFLDAFGAAAAPGAPPGMPPPSALPGDGGPIGDGDPDASFAALLAVGTGPAGDAASAPQAAPAQGACATDPGLAAALQATWWFTSPKTPAAAEEPGGPVEQTETDPDAAAARALDPDDNAAAEWFITSGAVLTNLTVVDEPAAQLAEGDTDPVVSDDAGEASVSDRASKANASSPAYAIASGARHDAGVRRSVMPGEGRPSNDVAEAAHAAAAERRVADGKDPVPAGSEPPAPGAGSSGDANPAGEAGPVSTSPTQPGRAAGEATTPALSGVDVASSGPWSDPIDRGVSADRPAGELPATASDVAKAVAKPMATTSDAARRGPEVAAQATAVAQTEERRSSAAAARLANGIERGGGATAVASIAIAGTPVSSQAEPGNAAASVPTIETESVTVATGGELPSDPGGEDHSSGSEEGYNPADVPATPAPPRPASTMTASGTHLTAATQPAAPPVVSAPVMAAPAGTPAPSTATPGPDTLPQLVQTIRMQYRAGGGEAVVRLNPEHLGAVSISLRVERGVVSATVHAESPAVRQWLEGEEASLREGLSGHGLHLDRLIVHRDGRQPEQRHYEDQQPRRRAPRRQAGQEQATFEVRV